MSDFDRVRRMHGLSGAKFVELVEALKSGAVVAATPRPAHRIVPDDPEDDIVVAEAVAAAPGLAGGGLAVLLVGGYGVARQLFNTKFPPLP